MVRLSDFLQRFRPLVFGIEGGDFGLDAPVTPPVRAALRETADAIRQRLS
ncbi:hypothetical protein [Microtetraspora malaysiensis]|uniref:Uncharacterized protein n=1 Tax=Microtetraspora malaysiensis TaxID=161358 RepID=A0ABW6T2E0_9ACTN